MSSVEERIKQLDLENWIHENCTYKGKTHSTHWCLELYRRKEVLQILVDFKIIPLEKWRELLKLIENRPSHHWMVNNLDKIEVVEMYFQKIEEKLEELQNE